MWHVIKGPYRGLGKSLWYCNCSLTYEGILEFTLAGQRWQIYSSRVIKLCSLLLSNTSTYWFLNGLHQIWITNTLPLSLHPAFDYMLIWGVNRVQRTWQDHNEKWSWCWVKQVSDTVTADSIDILLFTWPKRCILLYPFCHWLQCMWTILVLCSALFRCWVQYRMNAKSVDKRRKPCLPT